MLVSVVVHGATTFAYQAPETPYYDKLEDYSYIRPQLLSRTIRFSMTPEGSDESKVQYVPRAKTFLGFSVHLFDIDVGLNFPLKRSPGSKNLDLQGHIFTKRWGGDVMWQRFNRFNPPKSLAEARLAHTLINGYYVFNYRQYSLKAVTNQNEYQERSAGSVIIHTIISRLHVEDSALVPTSSAADFGQYSDLQTYSHWMWGLLPGYAYTHVQKPFVISGSLSVGGAHYWESYHLTDRAIRDVNIKPIYHFTTYLGVDSKHNFAGIRMEMRTFNSGTSKLNNKFFFYSIRISVGHRFLEKGPLKRGIFDLLERK